MVPVTWKMSIQGYVAMHLPMSILQEQENDVMNIIYLLILILLLIMLLMLAVFSFMVYRPLKKIIAGADQFASGNLKHNIPVYTRDEMGYLALTLNYMSDELDKTGEYQRKFVSNVSHDFRSPLTSIKGYTEAILDGTIPPELQNKYLNIVVYETDRLYKLTQSLLTLNDMDEKAECWNIQTLISTIPSRLPPPPLRASAVKNAFPLNCCSPGRPCMYPRIWVKYSRFSTT